MPHDKEKNIPMVATLPEILLAPSTTPHVVDDCYALIQREVADKTGISGTALKLAYKTAMTFAPGHVRHMVETLLPRMAEELQPFWADFNAAGGTEFGDYLAKRGEEVADALLTVTDDRAAASGRPIIVRAYRSVRASAAKHVEAALPQVGDLVLKYAA
jgi:uncharacterized protein DUF6918